MHRKKMLRFAPKCYERLQATVVFFFIFVLILQALYNKHVEHLFLKCYSKEC